MKICPWLPFPVGNILLQPYKSKSLRASLLDVSPWTTARETWVISAHIWHTHLLSASLQLGHVQAIRRFFSPGWPGSSRVRVWSTWMVGWPCVVASWSPPPCIVWTVRCCWPDKTRRQTRGKRHSRAPARSVEVLWKSNQTTSWCFKQREFMKSFSILQTVYYCRFLRLNKTTQNVFFFFFFLLFTKIASWL